MGEIKVVTNLMKTSAWIGTPVVVIDTQVRIDVGVCNPGGGSNIEFGETGLRRTRVHTSVTCSTTGLHLPASTSTRRDTQHDMVIVLL